MRSALRDILTEEFLRLLGQLPAVLELPEGDPVRVEWLARKERLAEALDACPLGVSR